MIEKKHQDCWRCNLYARAAQQWHGVLYRSDTSDTLNGETCFAIVHEQETPDA